MIVLGARNILGSVNSDDIENMRMEREDRENPVDFSPGMDDDFGDLFSDDGGGSSFTSNNEFGSGTDGSFDFGNLGGFNDPLSGGMQQQQQQQPQSAEDKFWDFLTGAGKGFWEFSKSLASSFKSTDVSFWAGFGKLWFIVGLVEMGAGFILNIFGVHNMLQLCISGVLGVGTGGFLLLWNFEKADKELEDKINNGEGYEDSNSGLEDIGSSSDLGDMSFGDDFGDSDNWCDSDEDEWGDSDEDEWGDSDEDDGWGDSDEDDDSGWNLDDSDDIDDDEFFRGGAVEAQDKETVLASLPQMDKGVYTRQFLFDSVYPILSEVTPKFNKEREYSSDSNVFLAFDAKVKEAGEVLGIKPDNLPYLETLKETLLTIELCVSRNTKYNAEELGNEIAKIFAFECDDEDTKNAVYANTVTVGKHAYITIFTGENALVSLRDMYNNVKDYVLSTDNKMPVVMGIDQKGKVIVTDIKKDDTCMIIAGMPRSGKSWLVQAVLLQMCLYTPPSELNLYFFDPKADTSDFKRFTLPHVKGFASQYVDDSGNIVNPDERKIMDLLKWVVTVEAPRRKKLIGTAGVNIWDFKKKNPDVKLPLIYLIFDEMVTLSKMEKEQESQYQSYLDMIVTQFPNLGIRAMFIPHEVKNQIISKTAYDSVKSRISVRGSAEHIEASTGTKERNFKYKLTHIGDMAVKMDAVNSGNPTFVHGVALSTSNEENNEIFEYVRRLWNRIEPEESQNSVAKDIEIEQQLEKLQSNSGLDIDDLETDDMFTESNEDGVSSLNAEVVSNTQDNSDDDFWSSL